MAKIPLPWSFRINRAIDNLKFDPHLGEKMGGDMAPKRKIKVWPYRIMYIVDEKIKLISIMEVERRGHTSYD
jgi:mRNA-degrading endonuclease RelE of RelBE toxin-antitoxin system